MRKIKQFWNPDSLIFAIRRDPILNFDMIRISTFVKVPEHSFKLVTCRQIDKSEVKNKEIVT